MNTHQPCPRRGDWFRSREFTRIRCKEYSVPPSHCVSAEEALIGTMEPGQLFGPVHDVELFHEFVSVQVPSTMSGHRGTLVWVNIENYGQEFARMVPRKWSGFLD